MEKIIYPRKYVAADSCTKQAGLVGPSLPFNPIQTQKPDLDSDDDLNTNSLAESIISSILNEIRSSRSSENASRSSTCSSNTNQIDRMKSNSTNFFDDAILKKVIFKNENFHNKTNLFHINPELHTNVRLTQNERNVNQNFEFRLPKFDHRKAFYKDSSLINKELFQPKEAPVLNKNQLRDSQSKTKTTSEQNLNTNRKNYKKIDEKNQININTASSSIKQEKTDTKPAKNVFNNKNLKDSENLTEKNNIKDVRKQSVINPITKTVKRNIEKIIKPNYQKRFSEINEVKKIVKDDVEEMQDNFESNLNDQIDLDGSNRSNTSITLAKSSSKILAIRIPTAAHDSMNESSEFEENIVELVADDFVKKTPPISIADVENSADEEFDLNESFLSEKSVIEQLRQSPVDEFQNFIDTENINSKKRESLKLAIPIFNSPIHFEDKKKISSPSKYSPEISHADDIMDVIQDEFQDNELEIVVVDNENVGDDNELNNFLKEAVEQNNQPARSTPYLFLHGDYEIESPISITIRKITF